MVAAPQAVSRALRPSATIGQVLWSMGKPRTTWHKFVAVGDLFTEGLKTVCLTADTEDGRIVLQRCSRRAPTIFTYANLAVRGRKLDDIIGNQPLALEMEPDLVSIAGGVNDVLRPKWMWLPAVNCWKVVSSRHEIPGRRAALRIRRCRPTFPALSTVSSRLAQYREITLALAEEHDCYVVDFWPETVSDDSRFWAEDRLHLNELGHERVANVVATTLEIGDYDWREPLAATMPRSLTQTVRADIEWTGATSSPGWLDDCGARVRATK